MLTTLFLRLRLCNVGFSCFFLKYFRLIFVFSILLKASITYSQEDDFDLASEDFDLLEDTSFEELELDFEKDSTLTFKETNESTDLYQKNNEVNTLNSIDGLSGTIVQNFVYGLQSPSAIFNRSESGVERIQTYLNLDYKGALVPEVNYKIGGKAQYDWGKWQNNKFKTDESESVFYLRDFYLDYHPSSRIWLRIGNQIIARGQLDNLSITDTINPRDLSIPGQGELSEFRQQIPAILFSFPISDLKIELVLTRGAGGNVLGEKDESFDPTIQFSQNLANMESNPFTINYLKPRNQFEIFLNVNYPFNGGDFSLVFSDENQNQRSLKNIRATAFLNQLNFGFDRIQMIGFSGNLVRGDFLLKYEGASIFGASFLKTDPSDLPGLKKNQNALGFGFDYSGMDNLTLGYEGNLKVISNHTTNLITSKQTLGHSLQARWTALNEKLSFNTNFNRLTGEKSTINIISVSYMPKDGLALKARYVKYNAERLTDTLYPYKNQDVIMISSEYSF